MKPEGDVEIFQIPIWECLLLLGISLSHYRRMLKHLSVSSSHSGEIKARLLLLLANPHFHPSPSLSLPLCPTMSHSLVTYLVPVLRISTPRAISGIRKLLARNSIGVHSNSRIPYPLPVHTPIPCYTTLVRCALASFYEWKDRCQIQLSRDDFTIISADICEQIRVLYVLPEGDRGGLMRVGILNLGCYCARDLSYVGIRFEDRATRFLIWFG